MNRKWLITGMTVLLLASFIGTSYYYWTVIRIGTRNYNPDVKIDPQKNYTIEVWDFKNPHMYIDEKKQTEVWDEIIDQFKEIHPNIEIDVKLMDEEEYLEAIQRGANRNKMADIVIDWLGTPFIDLEMQIPASKYHDLSSENYMAGSLEYVTYNGEIVAFPIISIPNLLIGNREILDEHTNVIKLANEGWTLEELTEVSAGIKDEGKKPVNVLDYRGSFTSNLLVQGGVNSVTSEGDFNWYGHTLTSWFMEIDNLKNTQLVTYNKNWLADFWNGEVGILAGPQSWVVTETNNRNRALKEGEIRDAGSTKQIKPILLPYPTKLEHGNYYGMEQVSAIGFSQGKYKGEDHSKAVMEFLVFMEPRYALQLGNIHGFIPANLTLTKQWSEQNGLDTYSSRSIQLSALKGKPIKSRYFNEATKEVEQLEKIQPILDQFWIDEIELQEFINQISIQ